MSENRAQEGVLKYMRPGGIKTYQDTGIIIGVIGAGLQSPLTNNFAHLRLGASSEAGGAKAEQEELQGHHPQTTWKKHGKTIENNGSPLVVSFTAMVYPVHFEELRVMFKHLQPCPCRSY